MGIGIPKKEQDDLSHKHIDLVTIEYELHLWPVCQICGKEIKDYSLWSHLADELLQVNQSNIDSYKSEFFTEKIVNEELYTIKHYRNYLSILVNEEKYSDIEKLMHKIKYKLKKLSKNSEEIIDFFIYYTLATKKDIKPELQKLISKKDYFSFCRLLNLLENDIEKANRYNDKIGQFESNFQNGVELLYSIITKDSINIKYFNERYNRMGILHEVITLLSDDKNYSGELNRLKKYSLIIDGLNKRS